MWVVGEIYFNFWLLLLLWSRNLMVSDLGGRFSGKGVFGLFLAEKGSTVGQYQTLTLHNGDIPIPLFTRFHAHWYGAVILADLLDIWVLIVHDWTEPAHIFFKLSVCYSYCSMMQSTINYLVWICIRWPAPHVTFCFRQILLLWGQKLCV